MSDPLRFAFVVHIHQPVGNFDHVFREHVDEVYRPFLAATARLGCRPLTLHISGPLLDWLEEHDPSLLDEIGREVADSQIELLGSGRYEPVLAALPPRDRVEQLESMRDTLQRRFGVTPNGAWLTERVWEQDLAADMARSGVGYTLLDDRHFLSAGLTRDELDRPYHTEADGRGLRLLSIDERLRYLVPFRPHDEIGAFFRDRHAEGARAVVLGDDGEKFGGWPGTRKWVYEDGWLDGFLRLLDGMRSKGTIELVGAGEVAALESGGLVYPTPGSYREMEDWTLPRPAALELEALRDDFPDTAAIRGGHWRNFQRRYPASNRMHKAALALSRLCRDRGDPSEARTAIARAQCNDAYWHGVFGGVYLPHLRQAVWRELAAAEALLRQEEGLAHEVLDWDFDGSDEVWIHSPRFSAIVSPRRGGAVEMLLRLDTGENDADVLARHFEAYHGEPGLAPSWSEVREAMATAGTGANDVAGTGAATIHDRDPTVRPAPPAIDRHARALFHERIVDCDGRTSPPTVSDVEGYRLVDVAVGPAAAVVSLESTNQGRLKKRVSFRPDGHLSVELEWDPSALPEDAMVWTEVSLAYERTLAASPEPQEQREPIVTLARSERGYEEIRQGEAF
ncbi:MAG: alpha-amylase/4-alpha-glucanotransferase domain-containing protein, partial [Gemmatimonadota bacterium]